MAKPIAELTVRQLRDRLAAGDDIFLLDVREPDEYELANLGGHLIPLGELHQRLAELDQLREIVVYCHLGVRSAMAVQFLMKQGFEKVSNLAGGIDRWACEIDDRLPRY